MAITNKLDIFYSPLFLTAAAYRGRPIMISQFFHTPVEANAGLKS
jgi:hypothetical protein